MFAPAVRSKRIRFWSALRVATDGGDVLYRCPADLQLLIATRRDEKEIEAKNQLKLSREFGKSIEWLLTGEDNALQRK